MKRDADHDGHVNQLISFRALLLSATLIAACHYGPPIYQATGKLLVTRVTIAPGQNVPTNEDAQFVEMTKQIMFSQAMQRRIQIRLSKTPVEISENLAALKIEWLGNSNVIVVVVNSSSPGFARDYVNTLMDEYVKFRLEARTMTTGEGPELILRHEINWLSQELKAVDEKLASPTNRDDVALAAESP